MNWANTLTTWMATIHVRSVLMLVLAPALLVCSQCATQVSSLELFSVPWEAYCCPLRPLIYPVPLAFSSDSRE